MSRPTTQAIVDSILDALEAEREEVSVSDDVETDFYANINRVVMKEERPEDALINVIINS
jgi:bifunctional DNase/RNase